MRYIYLCFVLFLGFSPLLSASQSVKLRIRPYQVGGIKNYDLLSPYFSREQLDSLVNKPYEIGGTYDLVKDDTGTYAFSSCYLDVYEWKSGAWENLYGFDNKGYTCSAKFFIHNDSIYSLGGYGYWRNHLDLLSFDKGTGSWSLLTPKDQPLDFAPGIPAQSSNGIFVLLPFEENLRTGKKGTHSQGFFLDLEEMSWKYLSLGNMVSYDSYDTKFKTGTSEPLDTKDFLAFASSGNQNRRIGLLILDKASLELRFYRLESVANLIMLPSWILQVGNQITIETSWGEIQELDIEEFFNQGEYVGKAEILPMGPSEIEQLKREYVLIIATLLIITGVVLFFVVRKALNQANGQAEALGLGENGKPSNSIPPVNLEEQGLFHHIHSYQGKVLTADELDKVLNIDHLPNPDNKKVKRSRLIRELNLQSEETLGFPLITRKKNPDDKRYLLYEINSKRLN
ncbi:hypothetical protein [Algoriphagus limi]|uniref:Uncharacterized protein n=1 Tax=Algoriphagus limi TaxID=2975273 RepID=A0ABT2G1L5_9BACT|nr:hypothetical protein [Algoriphagus limi]MCS5489163.1 hypothetical protein [Algoriphagus limi]